MQKISQNNEEWKRYKEVSVPWAEYDAHRLGECGRILDLRKLFHELDKPVQRREFRLSKLVVLLLNFGEWKVEVKRKVKDLKQG